MSDPRSLLERESRRFTQHDGAFERLQRRRDRKRRNQRFTAGIVGIAVFVAAVWFVRDVTSLDSTRTVVPGGSGTSGPTVTGPTVSSPYDYDPTADYVGLPPKAAQPSGPETSELVAEAHEVHVGWVYVFEDGRVIADASWGEWPLPGVFPTEYGPSLRPDGITEQRLTPEGVDLVQSGVMSASDFICPEKPPSLGGLAIGCQGPLHEIPPSAWEDSTLRPYVPYRYAIGVDGPWEGLPVPAQDLLRGREAMFDVAWTRQKVEAYDITTEEARALDQILADAGFHAVSSTSYERRLHGGSDLGGLGVTFEPILPHGTFGSMGGG